MNIKPTLVIIAIFLILISIYLFFPKEIDQNSQSIFKKIGQEFGINTRNIDRIRVSSDQINYELKKNNHNWKIIEPISADAKSEIIDQLIRDLLAKTIKRKFIADDLNSYGIEPPKMTIVIRTPNFSRTFLIGKEAVNFSVYVKERDRAELFLIEASAVKDLSRSVEELRIKN